ncbi:signal peptidase I [Phenylobacterium sp.]|jgi:signal peptidase I|uniref:signal peptidase I n=1 Tax=Phenylobacterium sp. TaxID=1871053 RepID=UPI002F40DBC5
MIESVSAVPAKKAGALHETVEIVRTVATALVIALVLKTVLFQPFTIPSASMEPNLYQGDYIVVSKFAYGWSRHSIPFSPPVFHGRIFARSPQRGDVVVFKLPRDGHTDYIKRLIGLPGDRIQVKGGVLYLNGERVPRVQTASLKEDSGYGFTRDVMRFRETLPGGRSYMTNDFGTGERLDDTDVFVVPEGHYFMMGDNRDNSMDSRLPEEVGVGFVPAENLVGKAQIILLSWDKDVSLFKPWTWVLDAQPKRFFQVLR